MPPAVFFLRSCHPPILPTAVNLSRPGLQLTTSGWVASHTQPHSVVDSRKRFPEFHIPLKRSLLPVEGERRMGPAVKCSVAQYIPEWKTPPTPPTHSAWDSDEDVFGLDALCAAAGTKKPTLGVGGSHGSPSIVDPSNYGSSPPFSPLLCANSELSDAERERELSDAELEEANVFKKMFARSTSPPTGRRSASTDSHNPDLVTAKWTQPENLRVDGEGSVGETKPGMVITEATGESLYPWRQHWTGEPMRPGGFIRQYTADNNERDF